MTIAFVIRARIEWTRDKEANLWYASDFSKDKHYVFAKNSERLWPRKRTKLMYSSEVSVLTGDEGLYTFHSTCNIPLSLQDYPPHYKPRITSNTNSQGLDDFPEP